MTKFLKNVLITGAGKGIGEVTVKLFCPKAILYMHLLKIKKIILNLKIIKISQYLMVM